MIAATAQAVEDHYVFTQSMKISLFIGILATASFGSALAESAPIAIDIGNTTSNAEALQRLEASHARWLEAKEISGDSYSYQVVTSSWIGFRTETTITVTAGTVTRRAYVLVGPPVEPIEPPRFPTAIADQLFETYVEEGDDVGKDPRGAPPLTLDELYSIARDVLEQPLAEFERLFLSFDDRGLLRNCFKIDTRIADDVPRQGVAITNLRLAKPEDDSPLQRLEDSYSRWLEAKEKSGDNYSYQVISSSWIGFRSVTTITVTGGKVTRRAYKSHNPPVFLNSDARPIIEPSPPRIPTPIPNPEPETYVEEGDEIGKDPRGAPPLTLDELYGIARDLLLQPLADFEKLYLQFDRRGLLKNCFKIDIRIADDVPRQGVAITNLRLAEPGADWPPRDEAEPRRDLVALLMAKIEKLRQELRDARRIKDLRQRRTTVRRLKKQLKKRRGSLR